MDLFEKSPPRQKEKVEKPNFEPKDNKEYGTQKYWEDRFSQEEEYEWLVNYKQCREQLIEAIFGDDVVFEKLTAQ